MENELKEIRKIIIRDIIGMDYEENNPPTFLKDKTTIELLNEIIDIKNELQKNLKYISHQSLISDEALKVMMDDENIDNNNIDNNK
jgi:hypothetical protein